MSKRTAAASAKGTTGSKKKSKQPSLSGFIASNRSPDAIDDDVGAASRGGYRVFCDLDGVLVDFDAGVRRIFGGRSPSEYIPTA